MCNFATVMEKKRHALRKLMEAVEHELLKKPNRKTLDRLSMLFQETMHGDLGGETVYGGHHREEKSMDKKKETPNQ